MNHSQQERLNFLYEQHLTNLRLQGKRPATIDGYSRAVRHYSNHFDRRPDSLTTANLKNILIILSKLILGGVVKIDSNGFQFSIAIRSY